jgi:DNA-binding protein H-NS
MSKRYKELMAERRELEVRIEAAKQAERGQALTTIRELMAQFGITAGELATKRGRKKTGPLPAKYRDPISGKTWSGQGREPQWIAGKDRAAFAIVADTIHQAA